MPFFKKKSEHKGNERRQGALSNFLSEQGEALGNELDKLVDEEEIESRVDDLRKKLANRKERDSQGRRIRDSQGRRTQSESQNDQAVSAGCLTKLFLGVADLVIETSEGIYEGLAERGIVSKRRSFFQSRRDKDRDFLLGVIAFCLIILLFLLILLLFVKILF